MHKEVAALLEKNDQDLFMAGACHVFAKVLLEGVRSNRWEIGSATRVGEKMKPMHGFHIFVTDTIDIADVNRVQRFEEYATNWSANAHQIFKSCNCRLVLDKATSSELYAPVSEYPGFPENSFHHPVDPDFLHEAERRARAYIEDNVAKYHHLFN